MATADPPASVLFACTRNAVRSPMAEAMMKARFGRRIYVDSVGVGSAARLDPFAVEVMAERGIDLSRHHPKSLQERWDTSFDVVIALSEEAAERARELSRTMAIEVEFWPLADPTLATGNRGQRLEAYRTVRDEIDRRIRARFG